MLVSCSTVFVLWIWKYFLRNTPRKTQQEAIKRVVSSKIGSPLLRWLRRALCCTWTEKLKLNLPYLFFYPSDKFNKYISRNIILSIFHTYPNLKIYIFKSWAEIGKQHVVMVWPGVTRYWLKSLNRGSRAVLLRTKDLNNTHYCRTMFFT
jgi:hypothetical protein